MGKYILKRILWMIPVILGVTIVIFTLMHLVPGDPAITILGADAEPEEIMALRESLGLDDSFIVQLFRYLKQVYIDFDFGTSYLNGVSISAELSERVPRTIMLGLISVAVTVIVGIPLGILSATHQNTILDWLPLTVALVGVSMPGFWFALMLVMIFSVQLGWLPAMGMGGIEYWILPILSGSFAGIARIARLTRSSMLEVTGADYIVMARAKGMHERSVIYKHALPNALIPIITVLGTTFASLLGGGMLVETIFSIPGVGYYMVKSVNNRDYPAVLGSVLLISIVFTILMLVTDLTMAAVDPRIKAQFAGGHKKKSKKGTE